jgi:hypothetical protein
LPGGDGIDISIRAGVGPAVSVKYNTENGITYVGAGVGAGASVTVTKAGPQLTYRDGAHGLATQIQGSYGNGVVGVNGSLAVSSSGATISNGWGVGTIGTSVTATIGWKK